MSCKELSAREKEIFNMIRPTSFYDIVDVVRSERDQSRYNARRELRELRNLNENELTVEKLQ